MEISLPSSRQRAGLLAVSVLIAAAVIFQASEFWLANHWLASGQLATLARGAALVPHDGAAWDRLGRQRQWGLASSDSRGAIADYRKALRENPNSADFWMDLARAEEVSGEESGAAEAFARAQAVYPDSAEVAFYYGNFLLGRQQQTAAFAELRRAVRGDPSYLSAAISGAWRATGDAGQIIQNLLPSASAYLQAIRYFASIHQCDAALDVWSHLLASKMPIALSSSFPLIDELIAQDRNAGARRVWLQGLSAANQKNNRAMQTSSLWNGDFSRDFAGGGLGWRWDPVPGVFLSFEAAPSGKGRALRLDFNGSSNVNLTGPYEYVPVEPASRYRFTGLMRTDGITTESGPRISISDPNHPGAVNVVTANLTGTHEWTPLDADVITGPKTHFVVIRVIRPPSRLFDNKLDGTVWLSDLSLVSANANSESQ